MSKPMVKGHFDGKNIVPDEPCDFPPNTAVIITAVPDIDANSDDTRLSATALARAFAPSEPNYTTADVIPE